jgi:autotransporter-associated beta strand protein
VSAGALQYGNTNGVPSGAGKGNLALDGVLDLAGFSPAINGLTGAGNITNSAATNVTLTLGLNNQGGVFSGIVRQGATNVAITKVGTGSATLGGANTYRGVTTVSAGRLGLSTLHQGTNTVTVNDAATFGVIVSGTNFMQPQSLILGASTGATNEYANLSRTDITPVVVSNLTLNGTIRISVASATAAGVYPLIRYTNINGSGSFALGSVAVGVTATTITTNNNTIFLNVTAVTPYLWSGGTDNNWDLATFGNWTFNAAPTTYVNNSLVVFDDTAAGPTSVNLNATVVPAKITFNNTTKNYTLSSASGNSITGTGGLTKNGSGVLLLSGLSNSFSGGLLINAGTVAADGNDNLGAAIALNGGALSAAASFTISNRTVTGNGALDAADGQTLSFLGLITGSTNIIKTGLGTLELTGPRAGWIGNFVVNGGTVLATNTQNDPGTATALGDNSVAGRIHTVNTNGLMRFLVNNMFGNQNNVGTLPTVVIDGGTLDSTRYNQVSNISLRNGGTLTQSATDSGNYEGYQFLGNITVTGNLPSTITSGNGKADHLGTNTIFTVADVTGDANPDLIVSTPLRNVSGDYALAPGTLNKTGAGTMLLNAANVYNGVTTVSNGTLVISSLHVGNGAFVVRDGASLGVTNAQNVASAALASLTLGTAGPTVLEFQGLSDTLTPVANVAGALAVNGGSVIRITGTNSLVPGSVYPLVKYGSRTGAGSFSLALPPGVSATLNNDVGNSWYALNFTGFTSVNTNPSNIVFSVAGGTINLSWPPDHLGWTLQTNAARITDPSAWFAYPGSTSVTNLSFTIDPSKTNVFFRLVYP